MVVTTVGAIILDEGGSGRMLLTRRNVDPFRGRWCLPGGHVEPGERAEAAVIREVKEESGLDFDPRFFAYFDEIFPDLGFHHVVLMFTGAGRGRVQADEGEVAETSWMTLDEARALSLAFIHNEILDRYAGETSA